ncbi:MAG: diguanylate cyclase [Proteobacteria bacterium]|nr:diguanylate cyclase [Pseudomonadota bacterium]
MNIFLALLLLALGLSWTGSAHGRAPLADAIVDQAEDDPRTALALADAKLTEARQRGDGPLLVWLWLARAEVHLISEQPDEAAHDLGMAREALALLPEPVDEGLRLTWGLTQLASQRHRLPQAEMTAQLATLRPRIQALGDARLLCDLAMAEAQEKRRAGDIDGAWLAGEAYARCARQQGNPYSMANALTGLSVLRDLMVTDADGVRTSLDYAQAALIALDGYPARFRRSIIEWEIGATLIDKGNSEAAVEPLERALALSRELGDAAGVAIASTDLARVELVRQRPQAALARLGATVLPASLPVDWRANAAKVRLRALAQLRQPQVLGELALARALLDELPRDRSRSSLLAAMAEAWASQGRHQAAYDALQEAEALLDGLRGQQRDQQAVRLQSRYEATLRQAEARRLRAEGEQARLALQAEAARREGLWALIAALTVAATVGAAAVLHLWRTRRLAADLALRDELTDTPNRRAVATYAQAQAELASRLDAPLTLALIDLDHFKRVNDTWGHDGGDAVLRAFARSAQRVLRGQDRLGRWGGEEWLLVMPGTRENELDAVFQRLRTAFAQADIAGLPKPHGLTFSMGAAMLTGAHTDWMNTVNWADQALYRAKQLGRDQMRCAGNDEDAL